jgi:serine/threonine protein kinase
MTRLASSESLRRTVDHSIAVIIEELTTRLQQGEVIDIEACCRTNPEHAERLRQLLPALKMLSSLGGESDNLTLLGEPLGDFRLIRELGRGGMGVVYEAEQLSLGRRVALKVLPFAATLDAKQLRRFQNEAQAAACLHHPNIVPVHGVGCARGLHYYAMQFIEGQSLARVIEEMRAQNKPAGIAHPANLSISTPPAAPMMGAPALAETTPRALVSTRQSIRATAHFRAVAHVGIQAAEALDHAHEQGVVHRDIKPANLLLDGRGSLWITDFGLAQLPSDSRLTLTGDLVGTLRYMSPEQAKGGNATLDHRTDIYSLGATLYELLTLEPALSGKNREELLCQAAASEYLPPRRLNRAVPAELETIVLKAMANEPGDRYQKVHALADDLRRWLVGTPIRARRPSWRRQLAWWGKRHRLLVATASVLIVAVLAFSVFDVWRGRRRIALLEQGVSEDIQSAENLQREGHWAEALQALERCDGRLSQGGPARLRDRVGDLRREIALVRALEACRLELLSMASGEPDFASADQSYLEAFRDHGLEAALADVECAASLIRDSAIRIQIVAGLDD